MEYDTLWLCVSQSNSKRFFFIFVNECILFRQTTSVTRVGGPGGLLKVRVEIDKIGDLKLKISDLFGGRKIIGTFFYIKF